MRLGRVRRAVATSAMAATLVTGIPGVVHADAAGPTDYRTEITAIRPATESIDVSIEGGDAFVRIEADEGHDVVVLGYDGEPYLRIDTEGAVFRNVRSYATYYNEERYGGTDIPATVDNDATPEWERVGDSGSWAWHDHRAHYMGTDRPIGMEPGDSFPAATIPILVDGQRVAIEVVTTLRADPSWLPAAFGALIGLQIVLLAGLIGPATRALAGLVLAGSALVVGLAQYVSLPPETGPAPSWWALPTLALGCIVATIAIYGRSSLVQQALIALAGLFLIAWSFQRRSGLTSAVLPTDLPFWLDRSVTAGCLVGGVALAGTAILDMFRISPPTPDRSPRRGH